MAYSVEIISTEEKDCLFDLYGDRFLYTAKSEIYGTCIKLLTDKDHIRNRWEDNFYTMGENMRSHGRVIVLDDNKEGARVKYDPMTKTALLFNFDYYGWIKSIALAIAGDLLEDNHHIYSVHGAALDIGGRGVSLIAPSKTGKTTHAWGLLRDDEARLITDDWYFVRLSSRRPLAFGSEKNCYIDADIGKIWSDYQGLVDRAQFDAQERAVVNVRWVTGPGSVIPMTTIYDIILLKRDKEDDAVVKKMDPEEALAYLEKHDFCNPHQLIRDSRKMGLRKRFFRRFLEKSTIHMVNTIKSPEQTHEAIRKEVLGISEL